MQMLHTFGDPNRILCKRPKIFMKFCLIKSISCIFTKFYKVFFHNDYKDLKVFSSGWPKFGTYPAIYRGAIDDCAFSIGVSGASRAEAAQPPESTVKIRLAFALLSRRSRRTPRA